MRQLIVVSMIAFLSIQMAAAADTLKLTKKVIVSEKVKISKAFRDIGRPIPELTKQRKLKMKESGIAVPGEDIVNIVPNQFPEPSSTQALKSAIDGAAQKTLLKSRSLGMEPELGVSFDGVGNVFGSVPPDTNGDVGPNHYVQTVNVAVGIFDKEGNVIVPPRAINDLWKDFGGLCETNNNGDPIVLYDSAADRWMISQFAFVNGDNRQCIAVSRTPDPAGEYYLYDFEYDPILFNDYPKFGVWTDAYYMGVNQFGAGAGQTGGVVAYERDKMLIGAEARQVRIGFENAPAGTLDSPMPLDIDGVEPPPEGSKQFFFSFPRTSSELINVWQFDLDWENPGAASFTKVTDVAIAPYNFTTRLVTQPNGAGLSSIDDRIMFRAAYRNLNGQGKVVFTHNVASPAEGGEVALRWYELNVDQVAGSASLVNQGTFAPDAKSRWMGSAAMDANGNIAVGYSIASPDLHPSIGAATRLATDPANTLTNEVRLHQGGGSQRAIDRGRWGDYSSMSVDPADECTFWYTTEYYKAENDNTLGWSTRISSFKIPSCTLGATGMLKGVVVSSDEAATPIPNMNVTVGMYATQTNAAGEFNLELPIGDYEILASGYGWDEAEAVDASIAEDETTELTFVLTASDPIEVKGKVYDSRLDAGLYARIDVQVPGYVITTFSDPSTGEYSVDLFDGPVVSFSVKEIASGGYLPLSQDVQPVVEMDDVDFDLIPNSNCLAPGYKYNTFRERFDVFPPEGWSVEDNNQGGLVWNALSNSVRNEVIPFDLDAAISDSDAAGPSVLGDTSLVTPVIAVTDITEAVLNFDSVFLSQPNVYFLNRFICFSYFN